MTTTRITLGLLLLISAGGLAACSDDSSTTDSGTAPADSGMVSDSGSPADGSTTDTGTPADGGGPSCDVVDQDCADTMQCVMDNMASSPSPMCQPSTGDLALGADCTAGTDCAEGLDCYTICLAYCRLDTDCTMGLTCDHSLAPGFDFGICND